MALVSILWKRYIQTKKNKVHKTRRYLYLRALQFRSETLWTAFLVSEGKVRYSKQALSHCNLKTHSPGVCLAEKCSCIIYPLQAFPGLAGRMPECVLWDPYETSLQQTEKIRFKLGKEWWSSPSFRKISCVFSLMQSKKDGWCLGSKHCTLSNRGLMFQVFW